MKKAKNKEKKIEPKLPPAWQCPTGKNTDECGSLPWCVNCYHFGKSSCQRPAGSKEEGAYYRYCFTCKYLKPEFISVKCTKGGF